jgi:hypothetical protein
LVSHQGQFDQIKQSRNLVEHGGRDGFSGVITMGNDVLKKVCDCGILFSFIGMMIVTISGIITPSSGKEWGALFFSPFLFFIIVRSRVARRPDYQIVPWQTIYVNLGMACIAIAMWLGGVWLLARVIVPVPAFLLPILLGFFAVAAYKCHKSRKEPHQVFINYAHEDYTQVSYLYQRLKDAGMTVWMDRENILPGTDWDYTIKRSIWRSDFFLACLTNNSVNRKGVLQAEIDEALQIWEEKSVEARFLIPVRIEECQIPEKVSRFQYVNLFAQDGYDRLLQVISR